MRQHAALQFDTVDMDKVLNSSNDTSSTANVLLPQAERPNAAGAAVGADGAMYGYYDLTWQQQQHGDQGAFAAATYDAPILPATQLPGVGGSALQQHLALAVTTAGTGHTAGMAGGRGGPGGRQSGCQVSPTSSTLLLPGCGVGLAAVSARHANWHLGLLL